MRIGLLAAPKQTGLGNLINLPIEAALVKVHHRPYSFENGPMVCMADAFDSHLRSD